MAVKIIDLQLLYGVAGARAEFEDLCAKLIKAENPKAKKPRVSQGDAGLDVFIDGPSSSDPIEAYQCKFFPQGLGDSQKQQIRESFKTCRTENNLKRWTLCIPLDLTKAEWQWFSTWRESQTKHGIEITDPWGADTLEHLLHQKKNEGFRNAYFKEEHLAQVRDLHTLLMRLLPDIHERLLAGSKEKPPTAEAKQAEAVKRVESGKFYGLTDRPVVLTSIFFAPADVDYELVDDRVGDIFKVNPTVFANACGWGSKTEVNEFSRSGSFLRASTRDYKAYADNRLWMGDSPEPVKYLMARPLVGNVVRSVLGAVALLNALQVEPPWEIAISIVGGQGWFLLTDGRENADRPFPAEPVNLSVLTVESIEQVADPLAVGKLLKPAIGLLFRTVGWGDNWLYNGDFLNVRI